MLDDAREEALRLVELANERRLILRIFGGIAFRIRSPSASAARSARPGQDIDFATNAASRRAVADLLRDEGYHADRHYNALNGNRQMYFVDEAHGRPVDVVVDRLEMCHTLEFADSFRGLGPTVSLADLLLSKLQVVELTSKDVADTLALLSDFPFGDESDDSIGLSQIASLTARDWGWWRTVTGNIAALSTIAEMTPDAPLGASSKLNGLREVIDGTPKTLRWKARSRIGDRLPWYQLPEEIEHA